MLVAAKERGFAAAAGLELALVRDISWATVRDRLVFRQVQAAHLLGPLAIAVSLGIGQHRAALAAPFLLNSTAIRSWSPARSRARAGFPGTARGDPAAASAALASALRGRGKPVFGIVHRASSHALMLRHWLAAAGLEAERDVLLRVLPPSLTAEALRAGEIDGFCAGEPWGSRAIGLGVGETMALGARIWRRGVEKVLALREDWMEANPEAVDRLLRALDRAARWCDDPANHPDLAALLARPCYVDQPAALILRALSGRLLLSRSGAAATAGDFLMFHRDATNYPSAGQALWTYAQFRRWRMVEASAQAEQDAASVFRPDIYRRALGGVAATPLPRDPEGFFDGRVFDPGRLEDYLSGFDLA